MKQQLTPPALIIFLIITIVLTVSPVYAQYFGVLSGMVIDSKTKKPIVGGTVNILELNKNKETDTTGKFIWENIPVGKYTLRVEHPGYINQVLPNQSVLPNKELSVEFELELDGMSLSTVVVKTFRYENDRTRPISTFSFSRDEISLNPGAQGDIFRAIGMLPGVTSSGGIYSAIAVRGQGVRDNVYMVDDIPLTEVGHLEGNSFFNDPNGGRFSIFAPRVIDNAVFQGGAFGTEFGRRSASYLGLSIKEGNKANPIVDGQIDLLGVTLNYDGPSYINNNTTLFISARYQNFYPVVKLVGLENLGLPSYGDLIIKTTTKLNTRNKLNVLFMVCPERFVRDMDNLYADKALNLLYLPDFKRNKVIAGINLKSILGKQTVWKNIAYYTKYTSDVNVGKAYPVADSLGKLQSLTFSFNSSIQTQQYDETKFGYRSVIETTIGIRDRLIAGLEADVVGLDNNRSLLVNDTSFIFRRAQLINPLQNFQVITPELVNASNNSYAANASAFINYYFELSNKISAQAGFRSDYNGFAKQLVIAPRATLSYHISYNHSISLGSGIYFQDPVYAEIADLPSGSRLKMEKVTHYIFAYKGYLRRDLKLMIEAWYKEFDNMVVTPVSGTILRNNNGEGYGQGIDISITKRLAGKWHGIASYSYMRVIRNDNDGLGEYNFTFSQPHQINFMMSYELNKRFSFSGRYRYATGRPTDAYTIHRNVLNSADYYAYSMELNGRNQARLPFFSSLDLRINYMFNYKKFKCSSFFDVVNILNRQIANNENFNHVFGTPFYDGLAIFPTGGFKFEF